MYVRISSVVCTVSRLKIVPTPAAAWWPDGQYTAPTDDALSFDIQAVKMFGLNTVRLHQKINPERWYWHADRLGVLVLQDAVQHFEFKDEPGAEGMSTKLFQEDWKAAIEGRVNHPSIIQVSNLANADFTRDLTKIRGCSGIFLTSLSTNLHCGMQQKFLILLELSTQLDWLTSIPVGREIIYTLAT